MAIARSCLTLWIYRILVPMQLDPPMTVPELCSDDQIQTLVGEGRGVLQLGLARVN